MQGLVAGDLALIETVLATAEELAVLGLPKAEVEKIAAAKARRVDDIKTLQKGSSAGTARRFGAGSTARCRTRFRLIPPRLGAGLVDVRKRRHLRRAAERPSTGKVAFLQVPEMVKLAGDVWKFVELPAAVDPEQPLVAGEGVIRASLFRQQSGPSRTKIRSSRKHSKSSRSMTTQRQGSGPGR